MRLAITTLAILLAACAGQQDSVPLRIAAASDLRFALDEVAGAYQGQNPGAALDIVYGSSGAFYTQIQNGAPFDLYFSADAEYPRRLAREGLTVEGSEFLYAVGRIVLWSATIEPNAETLRDPAIGKIAIANPQHAPYGRAAEAALQSLSLYEQVHDKLVLGENVAQTLQFVQSGGADVGIVALALALAPTVHGHYWEFPLDAYPRMEQGGAILKRSTDPAAAAAFRDFTLSPEGRAILTRYGFSEGD
ncbi:MAG: molybdate ABC transporter substrate-binding protein [Acidobacteria bacterium]|nr:molybdate ABC transporter substrate-binding protein [Acidobacteriota bacterium]